MTRVYAVGWTERFTLFTDPLTLSYERVTSDHNFLIFI